MIQESNDEEMIELERVTLKQLRCGPQSTIVAKSSSSTATNRKWKKTGAPSQQQCKDGDDLMSDATNRK
ncbi:hypothetical protein SESBI_10903 [Sesbania bispinosa]|nr:hypothetical protein SESBI_10903 [Sesbania bispinosa]